ncbi:alpha/beta hydrolase [Pseudonocardia nematodicida]|uniref:Alpha/beta hydrolase n=1 Tax=Pseudonocardia nematodicida TaxID=1206997 RepID=A0ABV1KKF7_9PSEU
MPALPDLVRAAPGLWLQRAAVWAALGETLDARADRLGRDGAAALPANWSGADAERARTAHTELRRRLRADAEAAARAAEVLGRHAGEVLEVQRQLVAAARAVRYPFYADLMTGTVLRVPGGPWAISLQTVAAAGMLALHAVVAARFARAVEAAVGVAARSDAATAAALRSLIPGGGETAGAGDPPVGPAAVRTWWADLSPDERDQLVRSRPQLVGGTDGIPVADRDRANRIRLDAERVQLRGLAARRRSTGDVDGASRAEAALAGLDAVAGRRDAGGAFLLDVAAGTGSGRVVLAVGDPERAAHVVTHVPGTAAGWASVPLDLRRVEATRDAARDAAAADDDVAAVLWTGYDAPTSLPDAGYGGSAAAGADALREFQEGLRAGHHGPVHLTVVGHSYGSTVTGRAAGPGVAADDVVFVGSPGAGVRHASELGLPADRVWATSAPGDPISRVPGPGLFGTSRGLHESGLAYGGNPASPAFGGRVFGSDPAVDDAHAGARAPASAGADAATKESLDSTHGGYWDPGTRSLRTLGKIVAGVTG